MSDETNGQDPAPDRALTDQQAEELAGLPPRPPDQPVPVQPVAVQPPVQQVQVVAAPPKQAPAGATVTTVLKPRADGMGYDEHTRIESKRPYSGPISEGIALVQQQAAPVPQPPPQSQPPPQADEKPDSDERLFGNIAKRELSAAKYFEECYKNRSCAYWKVEVRRTAPVKWPNDKRGKPLVQGDLGSIALDTFPSLRDRIIERFGGGRYLLILKDDQGGAGLGSNGNAVERLFINISVQDHPPLNPESSMEIETAELPKAVVPAPVPAPAVKAPEPEKEDRVAELRRKKLEKTEEAELQKLEAKIEKDQKASANEDSAELVSLREELRSSQDKMSELILTISNQSNETIKALAAKPQDSAIDKLLPILLASMSASKEEKKEADDQRRREAEAREAQRKEEAESRRRDDERREVLRKEELETRRREDEQRRKEELDTHRREDERREAQRKEESEQRRRDEEKQDIRRREEMQMLAKLFERKEDTTTPIMLKAIQESSQTFMQSMVEANKSTKGEIGETARTQSQFLERIIGVLTETSKADSGKYEKLLDSLIANRLESGSREVENFRNAMELGKTQLREAMQLVEARDEEDEEPPAPTVDPNQSMWANLSNVILALILSKAGNKDIQQGVASALGQPGNAQLTMGDYQQVAQGMTPMVAQQMGFPQQSMAVSPMMLPQQAQVPQAPMNFPPPQPAFVPPMQIPAAPVSILMPPGMQPMPQPMPQQAAPEVLTAAQPQGPKQLPPPPKLDAVSMQRLREQVDEMIDAACADIADESREQQWTDYAVGYLPKWFLDRMVVMISVNRPDLVINLIRQASSVEKFTRLNALVLDATKYQIFMSGLLDIASEHRDDRAEEGFIMPGATPVGPIPTLVPDAPVPASGPPASAMPPAVPVPANVQAPIILPNIPPPPASPA